MVHRFSRADDPPHSLRAGLFGSARISSRSMWGFTPPTLGRRTGRAASQRLHHRRVSLWGSLAGRRSDRGNLPRRFSEKGREVLRTDGIWVKSSHSESGACVEVSLRERVSVRDSKDPHLAGFSCDVTVWASFISAVHAPDAFPHK
ncbi:DUF397 domain-containing protein [Streptomyces bicolor]|uniref:DUF397 domain-containing protein n=1 Tax=Streptomyces bicolor TaxID=66874 RepID=UPI00099D2A56|nr:DUF397 domain-containing protein [Streptomyces bicolor]